MTPDPYKLLMLYYFFFDFWQFHICMQCIVIIFTPINTLYHHPNPDDFFLFPSGSPYTLLLYSFTGFLELNTTIVCS